MKKCQIPILLVLLLSASVSQAQLKWKVKRYLKGGLTVSNYVAEGFSGVFIGEKYGVHLGIGQEFLSWKKFTVRGEVLYNQKGFKFEEVPVPQLGFTTFTFHLNYLDGLLLLKYDLFKRWQIEMGGQVSYLISYDINDTNGIITYDNPNTWEFSPVLGFNFQINDFLDSYFRMTYGTWSSEGPFVQFNIAFMVGFQFNFSELQ